jgi:site-specific recombinase XerD
MDISILHGREGSTEEAEETLLALRETLAGGGGDEAAPKPQLDCAGNNSDLGVDRPVVVHQGCSMALRGVLGEDITEFISYMENEVQWSPNTISGYTYDLTEWQQYIDGQGIPLKGVSRTNARAYLAHLKNRTTKKGTPLEPKTIRRKITACSSFYSRLVAWDRGVEYNPFADLDLPRVPKRVPRCATVNEVDSLLGWPGNGPRELRDKAVIALLYGTGIRVSELEGIDVEDIDLEAREIRVIGKGDKERLVPFGDVTEDHIRAYLNVRPRLKPRDPALLVNDKGYRLQRNGMQWILGRLSELILDRKLNPHAFRHGFGQAMYNSGVKAEDAADMMGHGDPKTFLDNYRQVSTKRLHDAYDEHHPHARRKEQKLRVLTGGKR